jgi:hypothetical protein
LDSLLNACSGPERDDALQLDEVCAHRRPPLMDSMIDLVIEAQIGSCEVDFRFDVYL